MNIEKLRKLIDEQRDMLSKEMDTWGDKHEDGLSVKELKETFSRWVVELQKIETLELLQDGMESEL